MEDGSIAQNVYGNLSHFRTLPDIYSVESHQGLVYVFIPFHTKTDFFG